MGDGFGGSFWLGVAWFLLVVAALLVTWRHWPRVVAALAYRIERGAGVTVMGVKVDSLVLVPGKGPVPGQFVIMRDMGRVNARRAQPGGAVSRPVLTVGDDWINIRRALGTDQRGVHLVHDVRPHPLGGQHEVLLYIAPGVNRCDHVGQHDDMRDVKAAEFYLGDKWDHQVVTVGWDKRGPGDRRTLGIRTRAYAPMLALCRVTFTDGHQAVLSRFVDFEGVER